MQLESIIFDLDGVITSEEHYWEADRLSLWELLTSNRYLGIEGFFDPPVSSPVGRDEDRYRILSPVSIMGFKNSAINSNWDITYLAFTICLARVLRWLEKDDPAAAARLSEREPDGDFITRLREELKGRGPSMNSTWELMEEFLHSSDGITGSRLLERLGEFVKETTFIEGGEFHRDGPLWEISKGVFQGWVTGEAFQLQSSISHQFPAIRRTLWEQGIIDRTGNSNFKMDTALLPEARIKGILQKLVSGGIKLAVSTGRPKEEAVSALDSIGILDFFDDQRIVTQLEVESAEEALHGGEKNIRLSKPHPYPVLKAIYPRKSPQELLSLVSHGIDHKTHGMVGDSISDILSAKRAGCTAIGVLSGAGRDSGLEDEQRRIFTRMGADKVVSTIEDLPRMLSLE